MDHMGTQIADIGRMPRGGPRASCLDRLLETNHREYLDRDDIDERVKRSVVRALDRTGELFGAHDRFAEIALAEIADVPDPKVLELGAGHGGLSRRLLDAHPTAEVTITDLDETSVAKIAASDLGNHPRARVRVMDATAVDAPDSTYALAVFALSFHHLSPALAARAIAEGTRVADKLLIIDLPRPPAPLHVVRLLTLLPLAPFIPFLHDGVISSLRSYSAAALRALVAHAGPDIEAELRGGLFSEQVLVAKRSGD